MKATINKITRNSMQIDLEVTYSDEFGFEDKRVITIAEDNLKLNKREVEELLRAEGKRYLKVKEKENEFADLIGLELTLTK